MSSNLTSNLCKNFMDNKNGCNENMTIWGIKIGGRSVFFQMLICILFVFVFYCCSGLTQEYIFSIAKFKYSFFLSFFHFSFYSVCAFFQIYVFKSKKERRELKSTGFLRKNFGWLLLLSILRAIGKTASYGSLVFLNYPTKILMKSSKIIFIMFVGKIVLNKTYSLIEYFSSVFLIIGLFFVNTANKKVKLEFDFMGYILVVFSILPDSFASNLQEKILKNLKEPVIKMVLITNAVSAVVTFVLIISTGELFEAFEFCMKSPKIILAIILHSVFGFVGIQFLHTITKLFGILITQTVTSVRKVVTIFLSYIIFPKPFHFFHFLGCLFIFMGVFVRILSKMRGKKRIIIKKVLNSDTSQEV